MFLLALLKRRRKDVRMIRQYRAINNKPKRLGGFFSYLGGDSRWADRIVDMLPSGETFVEVFGGGGSVTIEALRRGKYHRYILNDIDPLVYHAYKQVINGTPTEWNRIIEEVNHIKKRIMFRNGKDWALRLLDKWNKECYENDVCDNALKALMLGFWMRGKPILQRTMSLLNNKRWINRWLNIKKLFQVHHARVYRKDAFRLIREFDSPSTVFYLDPPHVDEKNSGIYTFSFSVDDARRLGELLTRIKGRFVLKINPEDWVKVYSKVLRPIRDKLRVKRVKYVVNFARTGRGKVKREMVFVIKE